MQNPSQRHDNPEDYCLTKLEANKMRVKYLKIKAQEAHSELLTWKRYYLLNQQDWFVKWQYDEAILKSNKAEAKYKFFKSIVEAEEKNLPMTRSLFDLDAIKSIPINTITQVLPSGFFMNNPFRKEQSPSNSLHWNKSKNTWCDYGTGEHGSNIDLIMKMYNLNFVESCKYLLGC